MLQNATLVAEHSGACDNRSRMAESRAPFSPPKDAPAKQISPARTISPIEIRPSQAEKIICERCGTAEMYRMHAVWRCPACGFKTDCCGW